MNLVCQLHQGKPIEYFCSLQQAQCSTNKLLCHQCLNTHPHTHRIEKISDFHKFCEKGANFAGMVQNCIEELILCIDKKYNQVKKKLKQKFCISKQQLNDLNYHQTEHLLQEIIQADNSENKLLLDLQISTTGYIEIWENFFSSLNIENCIYLQPEQDEIKMAESLHKLGMEQLKQQNFLEGTTNIQQSLLFNPQNINALCDLGDVHLKQNAFVSALEQFEKALKVQQNNVRAQIGKANCYKLSKQYKEALVIYEYILQIDNQNIDAKLGKALCLLLLRDKVDEAKNLFLNILNSDQRNVQALFGVGDCLRVREKDDEAIQYFRRAISEDQNDVSSLSSLGDCYRLKREYQKSEEYLQKALQINPNHVLSLERYGDCLRQQGKFQLAIQYYSKVLSIEPSNTWAQQNKVKCQNNSKY